MRRVVSLSSVGAELAAGTGPIAGLHEQEQRLNARAGLDLLHLRPGYLMENHLRAAGTIAALCVDASLEHSDIAVSMIATPDIAAVVARELVDASTRGVLHLHARRQYTFQQVASVLGRAIGRPAGPHACASRAGSSARFDAGCRFLTRRRPPDGRDGRLVVGWPAHDAARPFGSNADHAEGLRAAVLRRLRNCVAQRAKDDDVVVKSACPRLQFSPAHVIVPNGHTKSSN